MKQYVGISRDHSASMSSLSRTALTDYNTTIQSIKSESQKNDIDTIVSVISHQGARNIKKEVINSGVDRLKPLTSYLTPGGDTPLFDSVQQLIELLEAVPDAKDPDVSFLIIAVTDGQDNSSNLSGQELGRIIKKFQGTDRWTFVFRVPFGGADTLTRFGIPAGNIQEWEQTERGFREATAHTQSAIGNYYTGRTLGARSTTAFYANMGNASQRTVAQAMPNIGKEVEIFPVSRRAEIGPFIAQKVRSNYQKGSAFYQLSKTEKEVQDYKLIVVRNRNTGAVYGGGDARRLLNLPTSGTIRLAPGDHGDWDIFIQSTSTNRILLPGTSVLYWENARS